MKKISLCIVVLILLVLPFGAAAAQELEVTRSFTTGEAEIGGTLTVTLTVTNNAASALEVTLEEKHILGAEYFGGLEVKTHTWEAVKIPYYEWTFNMPAGSSSSVTYTLKPIAVGTLYFAPATAKASGYHGSSSASSVTILCEADNVCDPGENYLHCPNDCQTGAADDICDYAVDDKCDPDCAPEADADCKATTQQKFNFKWIAFFVGGFLLVLIVIVCIVWLVKRSRKQHAKLKR